MPRAFKATRPVLLDLGGFTLRIPKGVELEVLDGPEWEQAVKWYVLNGSLEEVECRTFHEGAASG